MNNLTTLDLQLMPIGLRIENLHNKSQEYCRTRPGIKRDMVMKPRVNRRSVWAINMTASNGMRESSGTLQNSNENKTHYEMGRGHRFLALSNGIVSELQNLKDREVRDPSLRAPWDQLLRGRGSKILSSVTPEPEHQKPKPKTLIPHKP